MYIVHFSNPTRQIRLNANRMYVDEGFITFQLQRGPGEDDPLRVASFRADDVTAVYDQEYIESVIDLPNIGNGRRIPFETIQRVEPSAEYAPAIIRQGSTATEARHYPPLSTPFVASWEQEDADPSDPEPEVLNRAGQPVSFADRISRNPAMPTRLPAIPLPRTVERGGYETVDEVGPVIHARSYPTPPPVATREPFRVNPDNMMATTSGSRLYVTADEMISSTQASAAGENY